MNINTQLNWRYATKRMNGKIVPDSKIDSILESIHLAPSSYGLTPYSIFVISNPELRKKLQAAAYMQPQLTEGSHLLVFAGWTDITEKQVDDYVSLIVRTRGLPDSKSAEYKKMFWGTISGMSTSEKAVWAAKQAYIALGFGLVAAAVEEVDSTPMEGFDAGKVDEILGLKEKGLHAAVLLMLGYRDAERDHLAKAKKVRRASKNLFISLN